MNTLIKAFSCVLKIIFGSMQHWVCPFSKENERPRSLVYKVYETLNFLWAIFHALDSKPLLQDWGSAGCWWSRQKTNIAQKVILFFFQGTLRDTFSQNRKIGRRTTSIPFKCTNSVLEERGKVTKWFYRWEDKSEGKL
jgi:hypothetical protein